MIAALVVLHLPVLWLLYAIGIQYQRGGWWRLCLVAALPAMVVNVLANYSTLALLTWDWPRHKEYTFSVRLQRLVHSSGWRGAFARAVARRLLDPFDPDGIHIRE